MGGLREVGKDAGVVLEGGVGEDAPRIERYTIEISDYRRSVSRFSTDRTPARRNGSCRIRKCAILRIECSPCYDQLHHKRSERLIIQEINSITDQTSDLKT
jgi:hypothetical protein